MPTVFTAKIANGEVQTPKDFLHLCLRAFGILIDFRDDDYTVKDYTSEIIANAEKSIKYHKASLKAAEEYLDEIKKMTDEELYQHYVKKMKSTKESATEMLEYVNKNNILYDDFAYKIENWECSPEYQNVKDFALEQLNSSWTDPEYYENIINKIGDLSRESFEPMKDEYRQKMLNSAQWDVDYHKKQIEDEESNLAKNVSFYHFFLQEIEKLK